MQGPEPLTTPTAGPVPGEIHWLGSQHSGSIASLSDDILLYIFNCLSNLDKKETGKRNLMAASQACRLWRTVATKSPGPWTGISLHNVNLATLYLARSKRTPVDLRVNADERVPYYDNVAAVLAPHLSRIRSLNVARLTRNTLDSWMCYFNAHRSLNGLQDLELSIWPEAVDAIVLTNDVADKHRCHTPSLRHLRLLGILYPASSTLYDNLTSLTISGVHSTSITLEDLLHILGKSLNLTSLELSDLSIKHIEYTPANQLPHFPKLRRLTLNELVPEEVTALLSHLTLPAGFTHFSYRPKLSDDESPVVPFPPQRLDPSAGIWRFAFQGKYRETQGSDRFRTRISTFESAKPGKREVPTVDLHLPDGPPCLRGAVQWLAPNLRKTSRLFVANLLSAVSVSSWRTEILPDLPSIWMVQTVGCEESTISLLQALSGPAYTGSECPGPDSTGTSAPAMLCPRLGSLEISEYPHSRTAHRTWSAGDLETHARFWDALETMLVWRRSLGRQILTLSLYDVPLPPDDEVLDRVRRAVGCEFRLHVHNEEPMDVDAGSPYGDGRLWHAYQRVCRLGYDSFCYPDSEGFPMMRLDLPSVWE